MGIYILNLHIVAWDVTGTAWEVFTNEGDAHHWIEQRNRDSHEFSISSRYLECPTIDDVVYTPDTIEGCDRVGPGRWTVNFDRAQDDAPRPATVYRLLEDGVHLRSYHLPECAQVDCNLSEQNHQEHEYTLRHVVVPYRLERGQYVLPNLDAGKPILWARPNS